MSNFTKELVDDLAAKLLIGLTPSENKMLLDEFSYIEKSMELINKIDNISDVSPMVHPFPVDFVLNDDEANNELAIEDVLANCDDNEGREIKVPRVVKE